ncbi:MAG TPA: acyl carrier protein [Thermoanaerobaculia bacterium]|jgi:acyl carrier protein
MIERIKSILEEVRGVPGLSQNLSDSASLIDDVGLDSLEMLTFMLKIEERLRVRIDFEQMDFSYLQSIQALSEFLGRMERLDPNEPATSLDL